MSDELDCFLSYAREDKALADRLFLRLRRHGFRVWMDKPPQPYVSEGIVPGANWHEVLHEQIRKARFFLALFTETALESGSYFEHELKTALRLYSDKSDHQTFIVQVLSYGAVPDLNVAGLCFSAFQWIDIEGDGLNALVCYLQRSLPLQSHENQTTGGLTLDVATVDQLMDALGPKRMLRLAPGDYNLSKVRQTSHEFMSVVPEFDGPQLIFHNLKDTVLCAKGPEPAHLYVEPRYTFPIYLSGCENVRITNLRIGHSPEQGECVGGVVKIERSTTVDLNECDIYGCGTVGIVVQHAENIVLSDCLISDCNQGFATIEDSRNVVFHHFTVSRNAVHSGFVIENSTNVRIVDSVIGDNTRNRFLETETPMVLSSRSAGVALEGCHIKRHPFGRIVDPAQSVEVLRCNLPWQKGIMERLRGAFVGTVTMPGSRAGE